MVDERPGRTKPAPANRRRSSFLLRHAESESGVEEIDAGDCDTGPSKVASCQAP